MTITRQMTQLRSRNPRERLIRKALRGLARQRVAAILQPGGVWVVERAPIFEGLDEAVATCRLRGWVALIEDAIPHAWLPPSLDLPDPLFTETRAVYALTEAGWAVLHRTRTWIIATFAVAFAALIATGAGLLV
jgi:hypothetical protein